MKKKVRTRFKLWCVVMLGAWLLGSWSAAPARAEKPVLRVGIPEMMPPFAFRSEGRNQVRGLCVDLILMIGKLMGTNVKLYSRDFTHLTKGLTQGRYDLIITPLSPLNQGSQFQNIPTDIEIRKSLFVHKSCVTVNCAQDLVSSRIVTEHGRREKIKKRLPGSILTSTTTPTQSLQRLNEGKADVYISPNTLSTLYLIQKNGFENIKETGMPIETVPLSFFVLKERAEILSRISFSLGKIQGGDAYDALKKKWLGRSVDMGYWHRNIKLILAALGGLMTFLFILGGLNMMLKRKVNQITGDLALSEKKYRELIESSPEMIHIISEDGTIHLTNTIAAKSLGHENVSERLTHISQVVVDGQKDDISDFIEVLFKKGYGQQQFIFQSRDGDRVPVEMVATTIDELGQDQQMASCFSRDIRVRMGLEEKLIQSERLAIMGQMSAGLAHEINNPLGIILGHAQDMREMLLDEKNIPLLRQSLSVIENNADRAGKIVNDLLSFSRQSDPEKHRLDAVEVLEESLLFVHCKTKKKKVTIGTDYPEDPVYILGDENQIMQVLVNLLLNANQAVGEQGGKINAGITPVRESDSHISITVRDNGCGIKASEIEKVFDPFYTSKQNGFGLGLFISSMILERHNGTIDARSVEGQGTTMTIRLPLYAETA